MTPEIQTALQRMLLRSPASPEDLAALSRASWRPLPHDYVAFIQKSDGAEGWIGANHLQISSAKMAIEITSAFAEALPGLVFFAGDGAEALFAFDLRERDAAPVVIIHADDESDSEERVQLADSFSTFLVFLHSHNWIDHWSRL